MNSTIFTKEEIDDCNSIAKKYLKLNKKDIENRKIIDEIQSIYYEESQNGGKLLVCRDGSVLFAEDFINFKTHKFAFEQGLRSNKKLLQERKKEIQ